MMSSDPYAWSRASSVASDYLHGPNGLQPAFSQPFQLNHAPSFGRSLSLNRANSAVDMRQLTNALMSAREGTGEVRTALVSAAFRPRLPGLTKLVSKLSKEGAWRKALEVFETVEELGLRADTALTNSAISACDKGGRWQKALEIFDRMDAMRLPRDAITYSATISALAKGKQWHGALQIFNHMQSQGVEADVVTCCSLINALERGGQWQLAEKLFLEMCTVQEDDGQYSLHDAGTGSRDQQLMMFGGGAVGANSFLSRANTLPSGALMGLGGINDGAMANTGVPGGVVLSPVVEENAPQALLGMPGDGTNTTQASLPSMGILGLGNVGDPATENRLHVNNNDDGPPGFVQRNEEDGLASAFAKAASLSPSPSLTSAMETPGNHQLSPNSLFRAASLGGAVNGLGTMSAFSPQNNPQQPLNLAFPPGLNPSAPPSRLQRSNSIRQDPNGPMQAAAAAHLRRAMSCFPDLDTDADSASNPSQDTLTSMFTFSHAAKVTPNRVCCNALLAAYARAKPAQWQKAVHLLSAMWSGGPTLTPDAVSYNTVLKACANAFQVGKAMEVYREMRQRNVLSNTTTFNCLISAASISENAATMLELRNEIEYAQHEVKAATMNTYVAGLVKVKLWPEALAVFQQMLSPDSPAHPTAATFNTIMTGHLQSGNYAAVRQTFEDMRSAGVSPTIVAYNTVLAALAATGSWTDSLELLHALVSNAFKDGVTPNTSTYNTVLSALLKAVTNGNVAPEQHGAVATKAVQVVQIMQGGTNTGGGGGSNAVPDATTYSTLISILEATNNQNQIPAVHDVMTNLGLSPEGACAMTILNAAIAMNQTARAVSLAHSIQMQGVSVDPHVLTGLLASCVSAEAFQAAVSLCSSTAVAQGPGAAGAMFNFVLQNAVEKGRYDVAMEVLGVMQGAGLEVGGEVLEKLVGKGEIGQGSLANGTDKSSRQGSGDANDASMSNSSAFAAMAQQAPAVNNSYSTVTFTDGKESSTPPSNNSYLSRSLSTPNSGSLGLALGMNHHLSPNLTSTPGTPHVSFSPGANISPDSPAPTGEAQRSKRTLSLGTELDGFHSTGRGCSTPPMSEPKLTLVDTNGMLSALRSTGDVSGCLEVLNNMQLAGIKPDVESYLHVISCCLDQGEGQKAVEKCMEGHGKGVFKYYKVNTQDEASGVDGHCCVKGCSVDLAVVVTLAWLNSLSSPPQSKPLVIVTGEKDEGPASPAVAVQKELHKLFTTGNASNSVFEGLMSTDLRFDVTSLEDDERGMDDGGAVGLSVLVVKK